MRSPSARVLANRADIYAATSAQDGVGGPEFTYPDIATYLAEPCSIQAGAVEEIVDEQQRVTQERQYKVMFGRQLGAAPRYKLKYVDSLGVSHTLFARVERDEAGRGAAFVVRAIERV